MSQLFFKESGLVDHLWIGLEGTRESQNSTESAGESDFEFKWNDGSDLGFTNWEENIQKSLNDTIFGTNSTKICVQLVPEGPVGGERGGRDGSHVGGQGRISSLEIVSHWYVVSCSKRNLVVCQTNQILSLTHLKTAHENLEKEIRDHEKASCE